MAYNDEMYEYLLHGYLFFFR